MKTRNLAIAIILAPVILNAQTTFERTVGSFSKIETNGPVKINYRTSDTLSMKIKGEEKEVAQVETKVLNNTLYIDFNGKSYNETIIFITNPKIVSLTCAGASGFWTQNVLKADSFSIQGSGAGNIDLELEAKFVDCIASGAGNIRLRGTSDSFNALVSGAATLKAYDLHCMNVNVDASGASTAKVYASSKLNAKASGASTIKIKGEVKDLSAESTSAASITRIMDNNEKTSKGGDSTTIRWKGKKVIIIEGDKEKNKVRIGMDGSWDHWAGFSLGVNGLLTPAGTTSMEKPYNYMDLNYSRCINVQLNPFQHNFHIYKNYVNLVTGLGFEWRRYMLDHKTTLNPDSSFVAGKIDSTNTFSYNKNLFKSTLIQVPLLLEFNTSKKANKSFHIAVGAVGQFMINAKTKQILESKGDEFTKIHKDTYNMMPWSVKAHASLGYKNFTVYGEYNITPLFESGKGPQLYPFVAGVRLIAF